MKLIFLIRHYFFLLLFALTNTTQAQIIENASDYVSLIDNHHSQIVKLYSDYLEITNQNSNVALIEAKRKNLIYDLKELRATTKELPPFRYSTDLTKSLVDYSTCIIKTLKKDFRKVNLLSRDRMVNSKNLRYYHTALAKAEGKVSSGEKQLLTQRTAFIKQNEVQNISSPFTLSKLFEINQHARQLFLLQYQVRESNDAFETSLQNASYATIEKKRKALYKIAQTNLSKLKHLHKEIIDKHFFEQAVRLVKFYHIAASSDYINLIRVIKDGKNATSRDVNDYDSIWARHKKNEANVLSNFDNAYQKIITIQL